MDVSAPSNRMLTPYTMTSVVVSSRSTLHHLAPGGHHRVRSTLTLSIVVLGLPFHIRAPQPHAPKSRRKHELEPRSPWLARPLALRTRCAKICYDMTHGHAHRQARHSVSAQFAPSSICAQLDLRQICAQLDLRPARSPLSSISISARSALS